MYTFLIRHKSYLCYRIMWVLYINRSQSLTTHVSAVFRASAFFTVINIYHITHSASHTVRHIVAHNGTWYQDTIRATLPTSWFKTVSFYHVMTVICVFKRNFIHLPIIMWQSCVALPSMNPLWAITSNGPPMNPIYTPPPWTVHVIPDLEVYFFATESRAPPQDTQPVVSQSRHQW
jgi:hypothetical protein